MLILTRKNQEKIIIGDNIIVTVLSQKGNHIKVGITAPKDISVHREEVHQMLTNNNINKLHL